MARAIPAISRGPHVAGWRPTVSSHCDVPMK